VIADIRKYLETIPFVPFSVRVADGREYPVPTLDQVYLPPGGNRVVISEDAGITIAFPSLLISGLVQGQPERK
jgi:hypothetical protein